MLIFSKGFDKTSIVVTKMIAKQIVMFLGVIPLLIFIRDVYDKYIKKKQKTNEYLYGNQTGELNPCHIKLKVFIWKLINKTPITPAESNFSFKSIFEFKKYSITNTTIKIPQNINGKPSINWPLSNALVKNFENKSINWKFSLNTRLDKANFAFPPFNAYSVGNKVKQDIPTANNDEKI